jgi:GAF domain-containing protein
MSMQQTSSAWLPTAPPRWRALSVRLLLILSLLWALIAVVPAVFARGGLVLTALFMGAYVGVAALAILRESFRLQLVAALLVVYVLGMSMLFAPAGLAMATLMFLGLVVFATVLASTRLGAVATALSVLTIIALGGIVSAGGTSIPGGAATAALAVLVLGASVVGGYQLAHQEVSAAKAEANAALRGIEFERSDLEARVEARTDQLRAVIEVGRAASGILDPEQLTANAVNLISERFGYYYAAIFLVNQRGDQAELHSATGEAGKKLKENKHHLAVGGNSMVGRAISTREARIALDTGAEPVRFDNPLLPYTRSEIALPLIVGDRVIGALDVQSTKAGAFAPTDIVTLQGMANQVAIAFENARLFAESRQAVGDLEAIQRQYVASSWKPLMQDERLDYRLGEEEVPPDSSELHIPLALRDEIIGAINLSSESDWTPEQRNLVEAVATQAALALENARLVEASQTLARREHQLAEITTKVWASPTVEEVLRTALAELGGALGADRATIELRVDQK